MVENEGMIASARLKLASFHAIMLIIADGRVARSCILILLAVRHCVHTDCRDDVRQKTPIND